MATETAVDVSRYTNTKRITFDCEVLTPMFLGGADGQAELRSASFKALMRFWWRAIYANNYAEMKTQEDKIFGDTNKKAHFSIGVQGNFTAQKSNFPNSKKFIATSKGKTFPLFILDYLAYGLSEYQRGKGTVYIRHHIPSGSKFTVILDFVKAEFEKEILGSFYALAQFGALGARSRNGFGSFKILGENTSPSFTAAGPLTTFPSLNQKSRLYKTKIRYKRWEDALSDIGLFYKDARLVLEPRHQFTQRGFVARPIEVKGESIAPEIRKDRHPKSYFLSVGKDTEGFYGQILFLPVTYYKSSDQQAYERVYDTMNKIFAQKMQEFNLRGDT